MSDPLYLKMRYYAHFGKKLDLCNPRTFNEKMQWLKLYDRRPEYVVMVDKWAVKDYVAKKIGKDYIIPTLGVWDKFEDIDFALLPDRFVLKCTHDSGSIVICTDKQKFDWSQAGKRLKQSLQTNFFYNGREWPYKNVKPRIIAEKYMVDESGTELKDYKILNFNGKPRLIDVDYNRFTGHMRNLYTTDWKYIDASIEYPNDPEHQIKRPEQLSQMLELAGYLSEGVPFLRTDFYVINDKIYFGEFTFFHESGMGKFTPENLNEEMGKWIRLSMNI